MNWATYGVIIIFGAFVILMILNPNLSCFGRKITSPLYPVLRHKKKSQMRIKTQDYGFKLSDTGGKSAYHGRQIGKDEELYLSRFKDKKYKTKNYGFKLSDTDETQDVEKRGDSGENAP